MPPPPSATYERLRHTIAKRMRMSPIDQPLMLMELLGRSSPAPAQDLARRILGSAWWARCSAAVAEELLQGHANVLGDLTKQRRGKITSPVEWNCGAASSRITKLQMGAALTNHIEAQLPKDDRHLR